MLRPLAAVALLLTAALPAHASDADAWAPAKDGAILCSSPDFEKKTCDALSLVSFDPEGFMHNEDQWVQPEIDEGVVISMRSKASLKNGRSCMVYDEAFIDSASFARDGAPVPEDESANYRRRLKEALAEVIGHELCLRLSPYGKSYSAQMSIDGFEIAAATRWVAWVKPGNGYRLVSP